MLAAFDGDDGASVFGLARGGAGEEGDNAVDAFVGAFLLAGDGLCAELVERPPLGLVLVLLREVPAALMYNPPIQAREGRMATQQPLYDREDQYKQIAPMILPDETLFAVFDCKGAATGFVGITNKRLLFYDRVFLKKRKALVSIPYRMVTAVGSVDQGRGIFSISASSELVVKSGNDEYEFEFRGGDKGQKAYELIMREMLQSEPA